MKVSAGVSLAIVTTIEVEVELKLSLAKCCKKYLKMSGFSSKNGRYPRYQETKFLQLCQQVSGQTSPLALITTRQQLLERDVQKKGPRQEFWENITVPPSPARPRILQFLILLGRNFFH